MKRREFLRLMGVAAGALALPVPTIPSMGPSPRAAEFVENRKSRPGWKYDYRVFTENFVLLYAGTKTDLAHQALCQAKQALTLEHAFTGHHPDFSQGELLTWNGNGLYHVLVGCPGTKTPDCVYLPIKSQKA